MNGMLQYKGEDRLSSDELYKHPFLTKNIRDFTKIDTRRVQRKINKDGLNINVKKIRQYGEYLMKMMKKDC